MINRNSVTGATIGLLLIAFAPTQLHAEERLQPGLWTAQTSMGGRVLNEPVAVCITPEGAKTSNGTDDEVRQAILEETTRNGCGATDIIIDGPRIAFTSACKGLSSQTNITYSGTHYAGTLAVGDQVLDIAGERSGDCD